MLLKIEDRSGNLKDFALDGTLPDDLLERQASFSNVTFIGWYTYLDERVAVSGSCHYVAKLVCDRCGEDMTREFDTKVQATFAINPEEEEYPYDGEIIDLQKPIEDSINLDFPMRVLCRKDCKGLCPTCGVNLNKGKCDCVTNHDTHISGPFADLMEKYSLGGADNGSTKK